MSSTETAQIPSGVWPGPGFGSFYFLSGFGEGALFAGKMDLEYAAFTEWLKVTIGDSNWLRVCSSEKGMDEDQAREAFFTLWDEYRASGEAIHK